MLKIGLDTISVAGGGGTSGLDRPGADCDVATNAGKGLPFVWSSAFCA